jgi:hypothetical protein
MLGFDRNLIPLLRPVQRDFSRKFYDDRGMPKTPWPLRQFVGLGLAAVILTAVSACLVLSRPSIAIAQQTNEQLAQSDPEQASPKEGEKKQPPPSVPSDEVLLILIRASLIALNQASVTGNYTVLRDIAAPSFKDGNSTEKLAQIFSKIRNLNLAQTLIVMPKLYRKAGLTPKGMLRVTGFFPVQPERINFDLVFQPVQGRWRLLGISVTTGEPRQQPSLQVAPEAAEQTSPAPAATKPAAAPAAPKPKPKVTETTKAPSGGDVDVRDRLDNPPQPPPEKEKPKEKSFWNPFGR